VSLSLGEKERFLSLVYRANESEALLGVMVENLLQSFFVHCSSKESSFVSVDYIVLHASLCSSFPAYGKLEVDDSFGFLGV
jgi:hypothetical protein